MKSIIIGVFVFISAVLAQKRCTLREHMRHEFTECATPTATASVFFFYDSSEHCNLLISEKLPPFMKDEPCTQLCKNG
jgi:hypothetical protein